MNGKAVCRTALATPGVLIPQHVSCCLLPFSSLERFRTKGGSKVQTYSCRLQAPHVPHKSHGCCGHLLIIWAQFYGFV